MICWYLVLIAFCLRRTHHVVVGVVMTDHVLPEGEAGVVPFSFNLEHVVFGLMYDLVPLLITKVVLCKGKEGSWTVAIFTAVFTEDMKVVPWTTLRTMSKPVALSSA